MSAFSSASNSSRISPTISSRISSIVIRPEVPPYSSTRIAMWICCCCIRCIRLLIGMDSETDSTGCTKVEISRLGSSLSCMNNCLVLIKPRIWSLSPAITGIRVYCSFFITRRLNFRSTSRSMQTMSVRGTIISRASSSSKLKMRVT
ncbi:hypothetical protein D3C81_1694100 [compost metagenome]